MKKRILKVLSITIAISMFATTCFAVTGTSTVKNLRIREKPSTDNGVDIIELADEGDSLEILSSEGDWYKVVYNGKTGYASSQYVNVSGEVEETEPTEPEQPAEPTTPEPEKPAETTEQPTESNTSTTTTVLNGNKSMHLLPTLSSKKVGEIGENEEYKVLYSMNNWHKISVKGNTGWIYNGAETKPTTKPEPITEPEQPAEPTTPEPEKPEETTEQPAKTNDSSTEVGYVNVDVANVRDEASTDGDIVTGLVEFDEVTILDEEGDFYHIQKGTVEGYIAKRLVTIGTTASRSLTTRPSVVQDDEEEPDEEEGEVEQTSTQGQATSNTSANYAEGEEIVEFAKSLLGTDYVYGGKSPAVGFDCSGFTSYVYGHFGYELGATSGSQSDAGTEVEKSKMIPGDLIVFENDSQTMVGHVGIYIGDGEFIHAANPQRGVVIDDVDNSYYEPRFVSSRRIVE